MSTMQVFCIISDERAYRSKSPMVFTSVLKRLGIKGMYVPFKVEAAKIGHALESLKFLNIAGANITIPYKETVVPYMDVLSEGANIIGAINTVVISKAALKGYNTNAIGFMDTLNDVGFEPENKSALVFGTGGAARAVIFILNWLRTKTIYVTGRSRDKTRQLVSRFGGQPLSMATLGDQAPVVNIVVNATSVSSAEESPEMKALVSDLIFPGCELMIDLNYDRPDNFWQAIAKNKGIRFLDGLLPLAHQAKRTFALWTGLQVPPEAFIRAIELSSG